MLIDRLGDRFVVVAAGLLVSGSALGMVALAGQSFTPLPLGVLVLLAGLSIPAITTAVRPSPTPHR